jgi:chemotaxis family two-component system response regulator Rcp1
MRFLLKGKGNANMSDTSEVSGLPEVKSLKQIEVLVVQSNPADTFMTIEAFKSVGLTSGLHCVPEGSDALMYVKRRGRYTEASVPDLIFLDLSQPTLSALKIIRVVKSTPALMHIPIVVAAGSDDPKFVRSVYALNGNCFIRKPGEIENFVRFIETCYQFWGSVVTLAPPKTRRGKRSCALRPVRSESHS